jgi:hypothetical protein
MRAMRAETFGGYEGLKLTDLPRPKRLTLCGTSLRAARSAESSKQSDDVRKEDET